MAITVLVLGNNMDGRGTVIHDNYATAVSWVVSEGRLIVYDNDNKKLAEYNNGTWTKVITG